MHHALTIRTRRLLLRPPEPDDAAAIAERINNRRISSMTARVPWPYDLDDARAFIDHAASLAERGAVFVITGPERELIGTIGIERHDPAAAYELGYWLAEPWWNRGFMGEAARAVVAYAFEEKEYDRLAARCILGNEASRRVLLCLGFRHAGIDRCSSISTNCSPVCQCFEITRRDWQHLQRPGRA